MRQSVIRLLFGAVFVATMVFVSCQKDEKFHSVVVEGPAPKGNFEVKIDQTDPLNVVFASNYSDAESYLWLFGDGTRSTEPSPTHTFPGSGEYKVTLKVASAAGYTSTSSQTLTLIALATAGFDVAAFGLDASFSNSSTSYESVSWNFGDGSPVSSEVSPVHRYAVEGEYEVVLTVQGLAGNVASEKKLVQVTGGNLIIGGDMELGSANSWQTWAEQNDNPPQWGYQKDKPSGGIGGSLRFPAFATPSNGSINQLIYQPVEVEAGKRYQFSAQVKLPSGTRLYFQVYISNDPDNWVESVGPGGNHFLALNAWHGWGSETATAAVDGELADLVSKNGAYGFGAASNGVYTATETGTVYIGIQAGSWNGGSNGKDLLIDNVVFKELK